MSNVKIVITGTSPLLMHNTRLADPSDPIVQEMKIISGKRKKTDEDHAALARLEFLGGLYLNETGPYMPGANVQRAITDAARITREGKIVERGVILVEDAPLIYPGPRNGEALWEDGSFTSRAAVKVMTARVFRTRPKFDVWRVETNALIDTSVIEIEQMQRILQTSGAQVGLGDWRPRYGRFTATIRES